MRGKPMSPQRRAALLSVLAAVALVVMKLVVGITAHSLGLISEAIHSGTDLVAALLTFLALGVADRPADVQHQYGHGRAENLAALAEAAFLAIASIYIAVQAIDRLSGVHHPVHTGWAVFSVVGVVLIVDSSRAIVSWRTAQKYKSDALASNALHFASDFAGTLAVLAGLILSSQGHPSGDSYAALFVAVLVLGAAAQLIRHNVDVLMDRSPADAEAAARNAISALGPGLQLKRLRMRRSGTRQFADVVIGVSSLAAVGQGHAAADLVERTLEDVLPGSDVVVHVEPLPETSVWERAHAAALAVPRVREVHNVALYEIDGRSELSLHVKLPADLTLDHAHEVADSLERTIRVAVPEVDIVHSHIEPIAPPLEAHEIDFAAPEVARIVEEVTGQPPRELRFIRSDDGEIVAWLTLGLDGDMALRQAHREASEIEERIRRERPDIGDVVVHTEPDRMELP
ncbi:MAG: cation diffusion facilitator family transporter [Actinobacteria bacterium]|nr:cation diffusion facilitator family transporter [Actinomycetota bacterium]